VATRSVIDEAMVLAAAVAFLSFLLLFLSLWKPVDLWKTSISVRLGGQTVHCFGIVGKRSVTAQPGLASLRIFSPNLSKVSARFSSEAAAGHYDAYSDDVSGRLTIRIALFPACQAETLK
jgi:hypothetical protein